MRNFETDFSFDKDSKIGRLNGFDGFLRFRARLDSVCERVRVIRVGEDRQVVFVGSEIQEIAPDASRSPLHRKRRGESSGSRLERILWPLDGFLLCCPRNSLLGGACKAQWLALSQRSRFRGAHVTVNVVASPLCEVCKVKCGLAKLQAA